MENRRLNQRLRTLRGGRIVFNDNQSVISCTVRNLSDDGACLHVTSLVGIPATFDLRFDGDDTELQCSRMWQSDNRIGVKFTTAQQKPAAQWDETEHPNPAAVDRTAAAPVSQPTEHIRSELIRLRAALDEVKVGIVLLDSELRAQFINRAFRQMWRLPDSKADSKPAFVSLMYHGRDTQAYDVPEAEVDHYVAERVAHVKSGSSTPRDLRLRSGDVLRFQCMMLPDGGRMLTYTYVTDIFQYANNLDVLRGALDNVNQGVILLDPQLNAQFMNRAVRKLWGVTDAQADRKPHYSELVNDSRFTRAYGIPAEELDAFISRRIASIKFGDTRPIDLPVSDGRIIRSQCAVLPGRGRMLTYTDVTDLVRRPQNDKLMPG